MMKVFLTTESPSYAKWIVGAEIVDKLSDADIVIFTGGEDISPILYKESRIHKFTSTNKHRDNIDGAFFTKAIRLNKMLLGICRGAQFLTALAGGRVIQHVENHIRADGHEIETDNGDIFHITSTHHQMMYPYSAANYEIIAKSAPSLSDEYYKNDVQVSDMIEEPEIVYYPNIKALCVQGHPEIMSKEEPVVKYLNKLINKKLKNE